MGKRFILGIGSRRGAGLAVCPLFSAFCSVTLRAEKAKGTREAAGA